MLNEPPTQRLVTHTGFIVERIERVLGDADGNLLMLTDLGPAVVDDRDIGQLQLDIAGDDAGQERVMQRSRMRLRPAAHRRPAR